MKEKQLDISVLAVTSLGTTFCSLWALLYPYYCSYIHHKNSQMTMKNFYYNCTILLIGIPIGGMITPHIVNVVGIRATFLFIVALGAYQLYSLLYLDSVIMNILLGFFYGAQYTMNETATNLFLSLKYKNGVSFVKYVNSFRIVIVTMFGVVCQFLVNIHNEYPIYDPITNEKYFSEKISLNFKYFMIGLIIFQQLCFYSGFHFLQNPKGIQNNFKLWIKSILNNEEFIKQLDQNEVRNSLSKINLSSTDQKYKEDIEDKKLQENLIKNKKPENSIEPFAIVIISVILIVTLIQCFFCMNNFKYVGLVIGFSDYVLNFTFIFSNVGVVVANFLICYIWEKFPFQISLFLYVFSISMSVILGLISQFYKWTFLLTALFSRFNIGYHIMFVNLILYSLLPPKKGVYIAKYFYGCSPIAAFVQNLLNSYIFDEQNYIGIYYTLFLFTIIDFVLVFYFIKRFNIQKQQKNTV